MSKALVARNLHRIKGIENMQDSLV
jgi:hypothetical protein